MNKQTINPETLRKRNERDRETQEQREKRLERQRESKRQKRAQETDEQREERLINIHERRKNKQLTESNAQHQECLRRENECKRATRERNIQNRDEITDHTDNTQNETERNIPHRILQDFRKKWRIYNINHVQCVKSDLQQ